MSENIYLDNRQIKGEGVFGRVLLYLSLAVLLFSAIYFGTIYYDQVRISSIMPSFQSALDNHNYSAALDIYRDIQADVLSADPDKQDEVKQEQEILQEMEDVVFTRVDNIEAKIRSDRYTPSVDDKVFLEQMGELTGSRVSDWLESICQEFLLGTIEKPTLLFIFDQIGSYTNISAAAEPLMNEIDTIEIAKGDVQTAEACYAAGDYIQAVNLFQSVIDSYTGFVNEYAASRLSECKTVMYDPIMNQCKSLIENFRYYSAENILSDMSTVFPDDQNVASLLLKATENTSPVVTYTGGIQVLAVKSLIADTSMAFSSQNNAYTDASMLTTSEFSAILEQLYANNYILVDVHSVVDLSSPTSVIVSSMAIPEGKKPLVIIFENPNYSAYQYGYGLCDRLVLNEQNQVCGEYLNASGQTVVSRTAEAIGILDTFVEEHPDFTFDGAKGIISLSGYETVFGYITNSDQVDDRNTALAAKGLQSYNPTDEEISSNMDAVTSIIDRLTESGWTFASSTYGYVNANSCNLDYITSDTEKWLNQVGILTGDVQILVYPNGDFIKGSDDRCAYLESKGFRIFFGVGPIAYSTYGDNYLYFDRIMLNGDTLRNGSFASLFSAESVYDSARTIPMT